MTILLFATAYALVLLGIAYLLLERLLDRMQAQPIRVLIVEPIKVEGNGDLLRQAVSNVGHQVYRGTTLISRVMSSG